LMSLQKQSSQLPRWLASNPERDLAIWLVQLLQLLA
jgi:hypothetical protein